MKKLVTILLTILLITTPLQANAASIWKHALWAGTALGAAAILAPDKPDTHKNKADNIQYCVQQTEPSKVIACFDIKRQAYQKLVEVQEASPTSKFAVVEY